MASVKTCFKCLAAKPLDAFYAHPKMADGLLGKCKECTKSDAKSARCKRLDHYRQYDRDRGELPHRVVLRQQVVARYVVEFPDRVRANNALNHAVRDGRVIPWPVCAIPECSGKPVAHHPDYSRPLDVVWLCQAHHKQAHALVQRAA